MRSSRQLLLVLLPAVAAYLILAAFYTPLPLIDDFWQIFAFANAFTRSPTLAGKLHLLFTTQVGPYKLILDQALIALELGLLGRLNLPLLILAGNLVPLGTFALLWHHTRSAIFSPGYRTLLVLPVSLLLFSLNYAETLNWAMSGLQQPLVVLFALAAFHCLARPALSAAQLALACVFAALAFATFANGILVWPVGLLYLALHDRRVSRLAGWSLPFALSAAAYLHGYGTAGLVARASLLRKLAFVAMFLGGAGENMHHRPIPYLSLALGTGILAVLAHAAWTRYDRRQPFFALVALWLLATAAVVANARAGEGLHASLSSRYKLYADLGLILCYQYLLDRLDARAAARHPGALTDSRSPPSQVNRQSRRWLTAATAAALLINLGGDVAGAGLLGTRRSRAEAAMAQYLAAPSTASPMFFVPGVLPEAEAQLLKQRARDEMNEAIRLGIYQPPPCCRQH